MLRIRRNHLGSAVALLLGLGACTSTPVVSPSAAPASFAATALPTYQVASPSPLPNPTPSPIAGLPALAAEGAVDAGGSFGALGLWAIRGSSLFTSTDAGVTWRRGTVPISRSFGLDTNFVLDAAHAWAVRLGPGSSGDAGGPVTHYTVSRTSDGGRTWETVAVPGNYPGTMPSTEFIDTRDGYLLAAADRLGLGTSTLLRTTDGGASWTVAGHAPWLGSLLAVSDASTIWAGGQQQAGGLFAQPALAVSRDTGRTWTSVSLPGVAGTTEADCGCYLAQPPLFVSSTTGYVVLASSYTQLYRTTDAGRTWTVIAVRPNVQPSGLAAFDATDLLMSTINPGEIDVSRDGGTTWSTVDAGGAFSSTFVSWMAALGHTTAAALAPLPDSGTGLALLVTTNGGRAWTQMDVR